jgi:hypothetical protein
MDENPDGQPTVIHTNGGPHCAASHGHLRPPLTLTFLANAPGRRARSSTIHVRLYCRKRGTPISSELSRRPRQGCFAGRAEGL